MTLSKRLRSDSGCCSPSASPCSGPSPESLWSIRLSIQLRKAPSFLCPVAFTPQSAPLDTPFTPPQVAPGCHITYTFQNPKHYPSTSVALSLVICLFHTACKQILPDYGVAVMTTMPTPSAAPPNGGQIPPGMTQLELQKIYTVSIPQSLLVPRP